MSDEERLWHLRFRRGGEAREEGIARERLDEMFLDGVHCRGEGLVL